MEHISSGSVIVYTDFARHVGPIVCALNDKEIKAVGYYGSMSDKDKEESHMSWHDGHVTVMVATRAFGLGINKKNIRLVVQHGLPPDLSSWVEEFGQVDRDKFPATACIVFSEDDILHLCYWLCNGDKQCIFSTYTTYIFRSTGGIGDLKLSCNIDGVDDLKLSCKGYGIDHCFK